MPTTVEQLSPSRVKLTVEIPFADLKPHLDKAYREIAQQVTIPGFRKGKVPTMVIDQRFGRGMVLQEAINAALPDAYAAAVAEAALVPLSDPEVEVTKLEDRELVEFTAEVDVRPEITLPTYSDLSVTVEAPATDDAAVDAELDNLRARFGTLKGVERGAKEGDFLSVDLAATVDGEPVDEASTEGLSYELGSGTLVDGLDAAVDGLKAGESKEFPSALVAGDHAGKEAIITVTVQSVKERELPEADDDFAQMASEFDTLDELKADLAEKVAQQARAGLAGEIRDKVLDALIDATDIPTPESVVESEAHAQMHQLIDQFGGDPSILDQALAAEGTDRETFEAETREGAARAIRSQLLLDAVAEEASTEVSQEELTQHIMFQAQRYGMDPNQFVQQIQQAGQLGSLFSDVRRSKALADVISQVTVQDTDGNTVDTTEFFGSREDRNADSAEAGTEDDSTDEQDADA